MVVIVIVGGPSNNATPSSYILVNNNNSPALPPHGSPNHGLHVEAGPTAGPASPYQRLYNRSVSASNQRHGYRCYQKTPSHEETKVFSGVRPTYHKSLSVPQLSLGQRFVKTPETTKANQCRRSDSDNGDDDEPPLIRHITRVNICDASPQLDLANSNYGAIATTDAEPVTREGEY